MKLKILLILFLFAGIVNAQEPYRHLMITEASISPPHRAYVELTNMGEEDINLSEFEFGTIGNSTGTPILDVFTDPFSSADGADRSFMLPNVILEPGETFVITTAYDFGPRAYAKTPPALGADEAPRNPQIYDIADILLHMAEPNSNETDSVTTPENSPYSSAVLSLWEGRMPIYLEHHFTEGDSAAIDQYGGVFDNPDLPGSQRYEGVDVAGVENATANSIAVRKYKYDSGNLDFANARGLSEEDSEWIVLPRQYNGYRDLWWITGNHGNFVLDENTLESDVIEVDFSGKKLTVPWGIRRLDGIMRQMEKKGGVAWYYHLNENVEDSVFQSVKTGDKLEVIVCGNEKTTATFDIIVSEPTADANIVVPINHVDIDSYNEGGPITGSTQSGILNWPRVSINANGKDTISGYAHGLPYALRTDSLLKYLEKPANASWEFVWVDGAARPDLKNGDILKVTAQNGDIKEYYIKIKPYEKSDNALLAAITWPDVPEYLKGIYGWEGDTIPGFSGSTNNYRLEVPMEVDGIPSLVAKAVSLNAKIDVKRASSLTGSADMRTISFVVTAEEDSITNTYNVELVKQKDPDKVQPFLGQPFLSEMVMRSSWHNNFAEVFNPRNEPLDLSNYMFTYIWGSDPVSHIELRGGVDDFPNRYNKYIPGYKWVDETQWQIAPGTVEPDLAIDPVLQPGETFVMAYINQTNGTLVSAIPEYTYCYEEVDINFSYKPGDAILDRFNLQNPWNESISREQCMFGNTYGNNFLIWEILNDSVKLGLKPATDINDFRLVDHVGSASGWWTIGDETLTAQESWRRKPEVYTGNPVPQASFGTGPEDSEWVWWDATDWRLWGFPYGHWQKGVVTDIGKHFMKQPTHYMSTVSSITYKVSDGYSMNEEIYGMITGTSVDQFLAEIIKANENQSLTIKSFDDGSKIVGGDLLSTNDTLIVLSADSTNMSKYILEVSESGLSSNALLTSDLYDITIQEEPQSLGHATVEGFEYGTTLRTILNNVTVPPGATMSTIRPSHRDSIGSGEYVPLTMLNFDTTYVDVTVNSQIYLDVLAEDGKTQIRHQLIPSASASSAFILSDIYSVSQASNLINFIPRGTIVENFLSYLIPASGATMKLVDKMGYERMDGTIYEDDKVVVTSSDGTVTRVYHLSMLRTQYNQESTYLAYVLSDIYNVNQVDYIISGPYGDTALSEFYSGITPAMGATAVVVNSEGDTKTSGDLDAGDMLKVTSADGKIVVMYNIDVDMTSADELAKNRIHLYPNPTTGKVNIQGLERGTRVQVYNQVGAIITDMKADRSIETITLENQPAGIYLVVLTKDAQLLNQFKVVRR